MPFCPDVWERITDFLECDCVSQVCLTLRQSLGRRYVKMTWGTRRAADALALAKNLRILTLRVPDSTAAPRAVDLLRRAPALHTLTLDLQSTADTVAEALAALKGASALHTLALALGGMKLGASGARALASLKDMPAVRTMSLDIACNQVGPTGARALATLKEASALRDLAVNLRYSAEDQPPLGRKNRGRWLPKLWKTKNLLGLAWEVGGKR